jgi:hypothetical protein
MCYDLWQAFNRVITMDESFFREQIAQSWQILIYTNSIANFDTEFVFLNRPQSE